MSYLDRLQKGITVAGKKRPMPALAKRESQLATRIPPPPIKNNTAQWGDPHKLAVRNCIAKGIDTTKAISQVLGWQSFDQEKLRYMVKRIKEGKVPFPDEMTSQTTPPSLYNTNQFGPANDDDYYSDQDFEDELEEGESWKCQEDTKTVWVMESESAYMIQLVRLAGNIALICSDDGTILTITFTMKPPTFLECFTDDTKEIYDGMNFESVVDLQNAWGSLQKSVKHTATISFKNPILANKTKWTVRDVVKEEQRYVHIILPKEKNPEKDLVLLLPAPKIQKVDIE